MKIAISGTPGAGKSTVGKIIAKELNLKYISAGEIFREIARNMGKSIEELSKIAEEDESIDRMIDRKISELAKEDNIVVDARLSAFTVEDADVKLFIKASEYECAKRIAKRDSLPFEEALRRVKERRNSEISRYKKIYNIDINDESVYDIVIETTDKSIDEVKRCVLDAIKGGKYGSSRCG